MGGLESHDDVCAEICDRTGFRVVSCDDRLAPEHKHPAMFQDAYTVTVQTRAAFEGQVLLCGDSAGDNLAAAAHAMRGVTSRITGQALIYPGRDGDMAQGSYLTHAKAPMLRRDATFAPLHDVDFSGLPPTVIVSAQCDPLSDDGRDYRDAVKAANGRPVWINETGLGHGYLPARTSVKRAKDSFERIISALTDLGHGESSFD